MNVAVLRRALAVNCIVLFAALLPSLTRGAVLPSSIEVDATAGELAPSLTESVTLALSRRPANVLSGTRFRIISAAAQPGWTLVSVVALDDPQLDSHAPDAGGLSRLVLAQQLPDGTWQAAIDGEPAFARFLAATPPTLLTADAKVILGADPTLEMASSVNYKLPWPAGQAWGWWQGWHTSAHDLGTTSTDRRVLAAADGVVSAVYPCTLSTIIDLKHADGVVFRYIHIDKQSVDTATVRVGTRVPQGLVLGVVKPDTWSDGNCGYTNQSQGWAHLHWVMPTDRPITLDGWTVKFPTNVWRKHGATKVPGYGAASTLPSTNVATTSTQPTTSNFRVRAFVPMFR